MVVVVVVMMVVVVMVVVMVMGMVPPNIEDLTEVVHFVQRGDQPSMALLEARLETNALQCICSGQLELGQPKRWLELEVLVFCFVPPNPGFHFRL